MGDWTAACVIPPCHESLFGIVALFGIVSIRYLVLLESVLVKLVAELAACIFVDHKSDSRIFVCAFASIFFNLIGSYLTMASDDSDEELEFDESKEAEIERDASSSRDRGRAEKETYNSESPDSNDDEEESVGRYRRRATTSKLGGRRKRKASPVNLTPQ